MISIETIIQQAENLRVEFKTTFNNAAIETLVAFANAKGGSVYVGINDDGSVAGVHLSTESLQQWVNEVKSKTNPQLVPNAEVYLVEGKTVVELSTTEYPIKPVSVRGKYFKRVQNANHILFFNPGSLPDSITPEQLLANQYVSTPRNKQVAKLVKDMGLIEHYGTGIRRVRRIFTEYGLPEPEFTVIANGFLVKVLGTQPELENQDNMAHNFVVRPVDEGKINDGVTDRVTDRVDVTENQKAIIRLIEGKSTITSEEIASIIGISDRKIKENIKKLKGLGLLKRVGPDRGGHWQIIENK